MPFHPLPPPPATHSSPHSPLILTPRSVTLRFFSTESREKLWKPLTPINLGELLTHSNGKSDIETAFICY